MQEKNRISYINQWKKENKKRFSTDLDFTTYEEIINYIKENNINKAEFLRQSIIVLKNNQKKS